MIDDALREELSALLDGVLPEERAKELRQRIREEPELFREYVELERTVHAVRALPRKGAPAELRARLEDSLGGRRRRPGRIFRLGTVIAAAAAAVLLALGLALYLRREPPVHYEAKKDAERAADKNLPAAPAAPAEAADRLERAASESQVGNAESAKAQVARDKAEGRAGPKKASEDLLQSVAKTHTVPPDQRKAYLSQLAALGPEKARAHVRALFTEEPMRAAAGMAPVLATILLTDREEANLVQKILGPPPAASKEQATSLHVEQAVKNQVSTEVRGTPGDLWRLKQWLSLLDLQPAEAPRAVLFGESKGGASGAKAAPEPEVRSAIVRLKFGSPPKPGSK